MPPPAAAHVSDNSIASPAAAQCGRPDALARIEEFRPGNEGVEELDAWISADGLTPLQAADRYLAAHPELLP